MCVEFRSTFHHYTVARIDMVSGIRSELGYTDPLYHSRVFGSVMSGNKSNSLRVNVSADPDVEWTLFVTFHLLNIPRLDGRKW